MSSSLRRRLLVALGGALDAGELIPQLHTVILAQVLISYLLVEDHLLERRETLGLVDFTEQVGDVCQSGRLWHGRECRAPVAVHQMFGAWRGFGGIGFYHLAPIASGYYWRGASYSIGLNVIKIQCVLGANAKVTRGACFGFCLDFVQFGEQALFVCLGFLG